MIRPWILSVVVFLLPMTGLSADDWLRFRGPNGSGISAETTPVATQWSPDQNIQWRTDLPGAGVSSPIVVGERVFVTCYSDYGVNREEPGNIEDLKRHLVCLNASDGKILWSKAVDAIQPEDPYTGIGVTAHGYASHTPVSDGENVYVFYGKSGALAYSLDGEQLWQTELGKESDPRRWGSSSSPILFEDLLIVTASAESQAIVGLNKKTGEEVWRQEADMLDNLWGTPSLVEVDGSTELVVGVPNEIWGINPRNGKLRWYSKAIETDQFNSSVVVEGQNIYAIEGRNGGSIAIKAGGQGDVSGSHVLWTGRDAARFGSPIVSGNRIYYVANGIANCIDAKTGERIYRERLEGDDATEAPAQGGGQGPGQRGGRGGRGGFGGGRGGFGGDYASPVVANGNLYYVTRNGETYVIKLSDTFEQVAFNKTAKDAETFGGTPAISQGKIFLRSDKAVYCIGK
jgi:outer membrane protein assembly factor BamB